MIRTFVALVSDKPGVRIRVSSLFRRWNINAALRRTPLFALALPLLIVGCKSTSSPNSNTQATNTPVRTEIFPPHPTVPPPSFKVFHHGQSSFTLTTKPNATDEEIEALIWELRDAARSRTLDTLKISQKTFDTDGSIVWFHIYRGTKCAPEKYAPGALPCGASYHAAGDYTYSTVNHRPWDTGGIFHGEDHETRLWDPDASSLPSAPKTSPTQ